MKGAGMAQGQLQPQRPWREIAEEVCKVHDSSKVVELTEELIHALDGEAKQRTQGGTQRDEKGPHEAA
jgi:hypothetical protein